LRFDNYLINEYNNDDDADDDDDDHLLLLPQITHIGPCNPHHPTYTHAASELIAETDDMYL